MIKKVKQTPITLENLIPAIEKSLLPKIEKVLLPKFEKTLIPKIEGIVKTQIEQFKYEVNDRFDDIEERIKYLPTTEVYLKSQDELMGELQKLREETALTGLHYNDTNARIDKIDNYLNYNSNIL